MSVIHSRQAVLAVQGGAASELSWGCLALVGGAHGRAWRSVPANSVVSLAWKDCEQGCI